MKYYQINCEIVPDMDLPCDDNVQLKINQPVSSYKCCNYNN